MKNSILSTAISIFAGLLVFNAHAQYKTKKYLAKNKKCEVLSYTKTPTYSRGIHIEDDRIFTANADGSIHALSINTEKSKRLFQQDELKELRDIERSGEHLVAMKSGENGRIVRIHNQGKIELIKYPEWNNTFFDGIDFFGSFGFMMGDPIDGFFELYHTADGGKTWIPCDEKISAHAGEAGFAGSGTNVQVLNDSTYLFVSGGRKSRFFKSTDNGESWIDVIIPFYQEPSSGAFSVCFKNDSIGVVVGGDYLHPNLKLNTCYYTSNGGETWYNSENPPRGYRSCVFEKDGTYYSCGSNGIDFSLDHGRNWIPFANGNFFALSATSEKLVATTKDGKVHLFDLIIKKK